MARARARNESGSEAWDGSLSLNPRGFGFVAAAGHIDVYVPPEAIGAGMHGDTVTVRVTGRSPKGLEGRVERVVSRRNPRVAGVLRRRGRSAWLEPDDTRVRGPIVLSNVPKAEADGSAAVATITRFPEFPDENPEGELLSVLGTPGDPNVEVKKILIREQVEEQHSDGAVREAEAMAARLRRAAAANRRDLRDVPLPTIDPEDARDHDDAVWVERLGDGYRAWIAIADVSEYVQPGTALDEEALARGCTIYLPDRAIPMLPAALAADLCSLLPEQERLTLCVIADLDSEGELKSFEIVEGLMRSHAMLTYGGVARALGFTDKGPQSTQAEALKKELRVLDDLAKKLRKKRMARGALDLDLPEAKVVLDPDTGAPIDVVRRAQDPGIKRAYSMIEELMLLANETVAKFLQQKRCPAVYRIHAKPDPEKLERLGLVARKLGVEIDLDSLSEPRGVSRWLAKIQKHPRKNVLEMLLLRSLKQAVYDVSNVGHFGLASEAYVHFTSPIRRYPDVEIHRAVKHLVRGGKPNTTAAALESLSQAATRASTRERAAMEIEREVVDLHRCLLMRDRIGDTLEGTVSAIVGSGAFVSLDEPFVDVLVRFEGLGPDRYEQGEDQISVVGARSGDTISLGDRMLVTVEDVAVLRRAVYARRVLPEALVAKLEESGPPHAKGRPRTPERRPNAPWARVGESRGKKWGLRSDAGRTSGAGRSGGGGDRGRGSGGGGAGGSGGGGGGRGKSRGRRSGGKKGRR
jgi:ribonuclease R